MTFRLVAVRCRTRPFGQRTSGEDAKEKGHTMSKLTMRNALALGVAGAITLGAVSPTMALPLGSSGETVKKSAPDSTVTDVRWRRGWGWGIGVGAFALGA